MSKDTEERSHSNPVINYNNWRTAEHENSTGSKNSSAAVTRNHTYLVASGSNGSKDGLGLNRTNNSTIGNTDSRMLVRKDGIWGSTEYSDTRNNSQNLFNKNDCDKYIRKVKKAIKSLKLNPKELQRSNYEEPVISFPSNHSP